MQNAMKSEKDYERVNATHIRVPRQCHGLDFVALFEMPLPEQMAKASELTAANAQHASVVEMNLMIDDHARAQNLLAEIADESAGVHALVKGDILEEILLWALGAQHALHQILYADWRIEKIQKVTYQIGNQTAKEIPLDNLNF